MSSPRSARLIGSLSSSFKSQTSSRAFAACGLVNIQLSMNLQGAQVLECLHPDD